MKDCMYVHFVLKYIYVYIINYSLSLLLSLSFALSDLFRKYTLSECILRVHTLSIKMTRMHIHMGGCKYFSPYVRIMYRLIVLPVGIIRLCFFNLL